MFLLSETSYSKVKSPVLLASEESPTIPSPMLTLAPGLVLPDIITFPSAFASISAGISKRSVVFGLELSEVVTEELRVAR